MMSSDSPLGFDIEAATRNNLNYRQVVWTGNRIQIVIMSLQPGKDIGLETHDGPQFIRVETGSGIGHLGNIDYQLKDGSVLVIPDGIWHNVTNTGITPLRLYTIYSPPEHARGLIQVTKP